MFPQCMFGLCNLFGRATNGYELYACIQCTHPHIAVHLPFSLSFMKKLKYSWVYMHRICVRSVNKHTMRRFMVPFTKIFLPAPQSPFRSSSWYSMLVCFYLLFILFWILFFLCCWSSSQNISIVLWPFDCLPLLANVKRIHCTLYIVLGSNVGQHKNLLLWISEKCEM